jgi:hypothetical protein
MLDQVLNPNPAGPEPYPANMPIWQTQKRALKWTLNTSYNTSLSTTAQAPTGAIPGVDIQASAATAFKKSVKNYIEFDSLDTSIIQPSRSYIEDSLDNDDVIRYLNRQRGILGAHGAWAVYMISGLTIARGAKAAKCEEAREANVNANAGLAAVGVLNVGVGADVSSDGNAVVEFDSASDFVWAIRLTKISQGWFGAGRNVETVSKGATYGMGDGKEGKVSIEDVLTAEGLDTDRDVALFKESENDVFVVPENME